MRGFCGFLVAFSLTVSAGLAFGASYGPRAVRVENVKTSGGNVYARTIYSYREPTTSAVVYQAREVVTAAATAAGLLRFASGPAGLVTATVLPVFFEWFNSTPAPGGGTIQPDGTPTSAGQAGSCVAGSNSYVTNHSGTFTSLMAALAAEKAWYSANGYTVSGMFASGRNGYLRATHVNWGGVYDDLPVLAWNASSCQAVPGGLPMISPSVTTIPPEYLPYVTADDASGPVAMPNLDFWNKFLASPYGANQDMLRDVLTDENGVPWDTPENQAMRETIRDELAAQNGETPSSDPIETGPAYDPGNPDSPLTQQSPYEAVPGSGGNASASVGDLEFPIFCEWVGETICGWFGWTKEALVTDSPPSLPTVASEPGTWDSGLASGSCPPPVNISALGASVPISWQPACDFVGMLRPILIAFAGIAAALILLGQRAGGAG